MRRPTRLLLLLSLLCGLLVAGATAAPAQAATGPPVVSCDVDYVVVADWGAGHQATVVVTNTGTVPVWWSVRIRFGPHTAPALITAAEATVLRDVWQFDPPAWNSQPLLPGQSVSFGLLVVGPPVVEHIEVICHAA